MVLKRPIWIIALLVCSMAFAAEQRKVQRAAKVRSGPGVYYPIVERLDKGAVLHLLDKGDRWVKVKTPGGKQGYVSRKAFDKPPPPKGYEKVLSEAGLSGASTTVETMAARGLSPTPGSQNPLLAEYLQRAGFRPEGFGDFLDDLKPCTCEKILSKKGVPRQVESHPERYELERQLGLDLVSRVLSDKKLVTDAAVDDYVNKVGMAVALHSSRYDLSWRFVVFEETEAKMLSVPGGFVLLSSGLLKQLKDEAELAGVLGHAIAHIVLAHGAEDLKRAIKEKKKPEQVVEEAQRLLATARTKQHELEADALGMVLSTCAGYDPTALARVYKRINSFEPTDKNTPTTRARIRRMTRLQKAAKLPAGKKLKTRFVKIAQR